MLRGGSFVLYGAKLHFLCSTNRVPLSYEPSAADVAEVHLVRELLAGAGLDGNAVVKRLLGELAYRSGALGEELAECGVLLAAEKADPRLSRDGRKHTRAEPLVAIGLATAGRNGRRLAGALAIPHRSTRRRSQHNGFVS